MSCNSNRRMRTTHPAPPTERISKCKIDNTTSNHELDTGHVQLFQISLWLTIA